MILSKQDIRRLISEVLLELGPDTTTPGEPTVPAANPSPVDSSNVSAKVQSIFSSFQSQLNTSENQIIKRNEAELDKMLKGKTIKARASIGYKNVEKEYVINVKEVHLVFYYEEYVVSITGSEKNAKKDKEYILNSGFDVEIVGAMSTEPTAAVAPSKPQAPKPINPTVKPSTAPSSPSGAKPASPAASSTQPSAPQV